MATDTVGIELIPIESQTRTVQTCFQQCLYEVPNFQRPYSWETEQLHDFWDDVVLAQGDFFFGSTVTWVSEKRDLFNDTYSIIDGQQRLTTSAIFLSVIRDAFVNIHKREGVEEETAQAARSQAQATQRYLVIADDDGREYPVLTRPEPMFYEVVQRPGAIPSGESWNGSAEKIGAARIYFENRVLAEIAGLAESEQLEDLKRMRANVLKARVIQVELASEEDGFLIFETLNTRGADLRLADLVKNLLIRGGAVSSADRDAIAARWERVADRIQALSTSSDVIDRFIWQSWNSRRAAHKEPELFKAIGKHVGSSAGAHIAYLQELEVDSMTYQWLENDTVDVQPKASGVRNAFTIPEFVDSLRALAIFNVSVANSTVLAIARKYAETNLVKRAQVIEVMRLVENFHFRFNALTNSGSTGGTRGRYNRFAVVLEAATSRSEVADAIAELAAKLRASAPKEDITRESFSTLFYAPRLGLKQAQKMRARRIFIAYILMTIAKRQNAIPVGTRTDLWSIEHIRPQALGAGEASDPAYSLGNLTLVSVALNGEMGDAVFERKVEALRKGSAYFDPSLTEWATLPVEPATPTDAEIQKRTNALVEEALTKTWAL